MRDPDCIFCKIVEGALPAEKLYEDQHVIAFRDASPSAPIHALIVPRQHVPTLNDLSEGDPLLCHIGNVAKKLAKQLGMAEAGYRFLINVNKEGGQVIFHLHAHIMGGKDLGMTIIKSAVMLGMIWRKLTSFFGRRQ